MQLFAFMTLAFVFAAAVVSATPVPVNAGEVRMTKNEPKPLHTGVAQIPHSVAAVSGHDSTGDVDIVLGSHNLRRDMNKFSKRGPITPHAWGGPPSPPPPKKPSIVAKVVKAFKKLNPFKKPRS